MGDRGSTYRAFAALQALRLVGLLCMVLVTQRAAADEIVRWVDADGGTHFSDPHLAAVPATVVDVQPANAMAVPTTAARSGDGHPSFTKISIPEKKNKRGWRGYQSTRRGAPGTRGNRR